MTQTDWITAEITQLGQQICHIGSLLWQRQLVASNDGNISVRLSDGNVLCTPTNISKGFMQVADLVVLDSAGVQLHGVRRASSEVKMHLRVYQDLPEVHAVVHAHPTFATIYALNGVAPPTDLVAETAVLMPQIPVAPFAVPSTGQVPDSLTGMLTQSSVCLLEHHGALSWGGDLMSAYMDMERLEHIAKMAYFAQAAGMDRQLSKAQKLALAQVFPQVIV